MPPLRALIFDVDGTLADTERDAHRVAFNDAFAELGLPFHWDVETYGQYLQVTGGKERLRAYLQDHPQYPQISDAEIRRIHARKTERYGEIIASGGIALRPGIARLLAEAQEQDLLLAIATTTTPANVKALLHSTLGAQGWSRFQYIGAGDVVPHKKPAPDIYLHVLEKLGLSPKECLALEDSENGLEFGLLLAFLAVLAMGAKPIDHQFNLLDQIVLGHLWLGNLAIGQANDLTTTQAVKMGMGRPLGGNGTKSPNSIIGSDPVGQALLHEPIQASIQGYPIHAFAPLRQNTFLDLQVTDWVCHLEECLQNLYPSTGGTQATGTESSACLSRWSYGIAHDGMVTR